MIATSEISMPYSRRLFLMKPAWPDAGAAAGTGCTMWAAVFTASRSGGMDAAPGGHDHAHDLFLRGLGHRKFGDKAPFVHHVDAVAHAEQFGQFGRNHEDAFALARELV